MKLSEETLDILRSYQAINTGMVVKKGSMLRVFSENNDTFAKAKVEENFEQDFCIYDMAQFISILEKLFDDPDLDFKSNHVNISDASRSAKYYYSNPEYINYNNKDIRIPRDSVKLNFELNREVIQNLSNAAAITGLQKICFTNKDGKLFANLLRADGNEEKSSEYGIVLGDLETKDKFNLYISADKLKCLYKGDYDIRIAESSVFLFCAKNKSVKLDYIIAMKKDSEWK